MISRIRFVSVIAIMLFAAIGCEKKRLPQSSDPRMAKKTDAPVAMDVVGTAAAPDEGQADASALLRETDAVSDTGDTNPITQTTDEKTDLAADTTEDAQTHTTERAADNVTDSDNAYVWKKGDKLPQVIRERFGFRPYKDWTDSFRVEPIENFVLERNGLENKRQIAVGTVLDIPPRAQLFVDVGFPRDLVPHLTALFETENSYFELGEKAVERMCEEPPKLPRKLKETFSDMANRTAAFRTALSALESPTGKLLRKVLIKLKDLEAGFRHVATYRMYDEEYCDFGGKDMIGTKRQFSNLAYRLYKWSKSRQTASSTTPQK